LIEKDASTVGVVGSSRSPIKVTLSEYQGIRTIDIRKHYFDKESHELKPTTKGIAIALGNYQELQKLLSDNSDEILAWLEGSPSNQNIDNAHAEHKDAQNAKAAARVAIVPYTSEHSTRKSQAFFLSESRGGSDLLELNEGHPFVGALTEIGNRDKNSETLILDLLAAFHRAKALFVGQGEKLLPEEIFETLEFNWGLYLKKIMLNKGQ
jgi:hypothetical protein